MRGREARMNYKEAILKLLEKADERKLELIWKFVKAVIGKSK